MRTLSVVIFALLALFTFANRDQNCGNSGYYCADTDTCCEMTDGSWGCCPYSNGVCCNDNSCCPTHTLCDNSCQGEVMSLYNHLFVQDNNQEEALNQDY